MSSTTTTVKDLPKELLIADNLKGELLKEHNLKHTEAAEKNSLPTVEDLKLEKTHQGLLKGVEGFENEKLKNVKTRQPVSPSAAMQTELARDSSLSAVNDFDRAILKPTETKEKVILPGEEDIKTEKNHQGILQGVECFENEKLKNVKTRQPVSPSAAMQTELARDSSLSAVSDFDRANLKPTETKEKVILPGEEDIKTEKTHQGILLGVEAFENEKLKTVKTRQPVSPSAVMQNELARDSSLTAVSDFDRANLKKAETAEKNPLPSSEVIAQEMEHIKFKVGIEKYDKTKLSHTETLEKNILPTQEIIAMEKSQ